jgi:hypothetical protein
MFLTLRKPNPSGRKLNRSFVGIFTIGLVLASAYFISAQEDTRPDRSSRQQGERGQRGERGRGQFDPAQMAERQTQRAIENLNLSDEESAVLVPRIKAIAQHRLQQRQALRPLTQALRTAVDGENQAEIKSALDALKAQQDEQQTKAEALERELVELLTLRQEAQLTIAGVVNSDSGFGGFGGRRGGLGGGDRRRGDRPDRPRGNQ